MNKIITYIKYNKKIFLNLLLLILVLIGIYIAFKIM